MLTLKDRYYADAIAEGMEKGIDKLANTLLKMYQQGIEPNEIFRMFETKNIREVIIGEQEFL